MRNVRPTEEQRHMIRWVVFIVGVLIFGSACTDSGHSMNSLEHRIGFFQELGLLPGDTPTTTNELAVAVANAYREEWGEEIDISGSLADLEILRYGGAAIWWEDTEADVYPGNDVYVRVIAEWAAISHGSFAPERIEESWESDSGPITVSFSLSGNLVSLRPEYLDDYIDPRILVQINDTIRSSGRQFELHRAFDQTAFIVCLTQDQMERLRRRGWRFAW